ncbi:MAG: hypothetical protein J2P31_08105 [Blastocatellia bacterium]|nr:hypothetical protein [Blastocatellia bacterium]
MCDYSLHSFKNRLAVEGETLFVHRFLSGSKGLASPMDLERIKKQYQVTAESSIWMKFKSWMDRGMESANGQIERSLPAVCIPPGARLEVQGIPARLQKEHGLSETEEATFTQVTDKPYVYRDAFRFNNGRVLLIQQLNEGLQVSVRSLALAEEVEEKELRPVFTREYSSAR